MKIKLPLCVITLPTGLTLLAGCGSQPAKPSLPMSPLSSPSTSSAPVARPVPKEILQQAATRPAVPFDGEGWQSMFDGKTLAGWHATEFAGRAEVQCESGLIVLEMGDPFTGLNWTNDFPRMNYEVALDAMRVEGSDFFCGLTVPVGE